MGPAPGRCRGPPGQGPRSARRRPRCRAGRRAWGRRRCLPGSARLAHRLRCPRFRAAGLVGLRPCMAAGLSRRRWSARVGPGCPRLQERAGTRPLRPRWGSAGRAHHRRGPRPRVPPPPRPPGGSVRASLPRRRSSAGLGWVRRRRRRAPAGADCLLRPGWGAWARRRLCRVARLRCLGRPGWAVLCRRPWAVECARRRSVGGAPSRLLLPRRGWALRP